MTFAVLLATCLISSAAATDSSVGNLKATLDVLQPPKVENTLKMSFSEARSFPFRRYPKNFEGTVYIAPDGRLTIAYHFPSAYRILIDGDLITLVYENGEVRNLPDEARLQLFTDLLQWDTDAISRNWTATAIEREGDQTKLALKPVLPKLAESLKGLSITYDSQRVLAVSVKQKDGVDREYLFDQMESIGVSDTESQRAFDL